jgi:AraC-like DNA-binding protein
VAVINPGEPHTGHAVADIGWTYRMFYLDPAVLQQAASQVAGRPRDIPFFPADVIWDDELARLLWQLHSTLETFDPPRLEQESRLLWILARVVLRHADDRPALSGIGREDRSVQQIREFIEDHYTQDISIKQLAQLAFFSPFHLIRVFREATGMPPHAYLTQVRVTRAKQLLAQGRPIAQVALETGFVDQSHLNRYFKRIVGVTPGQYSKSVQDR